MRHDAIESVYLAVSDLDAACHPYERLGLKLSPAEGGRRTLHVGGPTNLFAVHFRSDPGSVDVADLNVALYVADFDAALQDLERKGIPAARVREGDADMAW